MKLVQVKQTEIEILERLLQLYLHDVSKYFPIDFDENAGLYLYDSLDKYFNDSKNYAYFIKLEEKIAGFILVDTTESENIIQEMFVLNHHKSNGVGKKAVYDILDKYKGNWVIKSLPSSEPAERFWNRTIKEYTNENYHVQHVGKYNRAIFTFNNSDE